MHVEKDQMDEVIDIPVYKPIKYDFSLPVTARLNP
jgi:hypothetical protein